MREIRFRELEGFLKTGREIEFAYNGKRYSITNDSLGYWNFCLDDDTGSTLLERVCPFSERDYLAAKIADMLIEGVTIRKIFDELRYDPSELFVC